MYNLVSRKFLLLLLPLLVGVSAIAQDGGQLRFFVGPGHTYRVKIDDEVKPVGNLFDVSAGEHKISVWAPYYILWDTTVTVTAGELVTVKKELKPTPELLKYNADEASARATLTTNTLLPLLATAGGTVASVLTLSPMLRNHREYVLADYEYRFEPANRALLQDNLDTQRSEFRRSRAVFYGVATFTVAAAAYTTYTFIKNHKSYVLPPPPKKTPWDELGFFVPPQGGFGLTATFSLSK